MLVINANNGTSSGGVYYSGGTAAGGTGGSLSTYGVGAAVVHKKNVTEFEKKVDLIKKELASLSDEEQQWSVVDKEVKFGKQIVVEVRCRLVAV